MRTRLSSVLFLILWSGAPQPLGQLPPEILADSHLLRAEQAIRDGDKDRARAEIDKITRLQRENELELPEEFHFRCAKTAAAAGLPQPALEAIEKYLLSAGRAAPHYVESLELMNQVQDAMRKEQQSASTGASRPTQETSTVAARLEADTTPGIPEVHEVLSDAAGMSEAIPVADCDLEKWNMRAFFSTATVESVSACIAAGANPNAQNKGKRMPLHYAAGHNENPEVIVALVRAGADPNARDRFKRTPLHYAAGYNENPEVIAALVGAGADPNARDGNKKTPLHRAAQSNENPEVIAALVGAGADPNAWDFPLAILVYGKSMPLHWAARSNENPEVIAALMRAGADPNARNSDKKTPLDLAKRHRNHSVIEVLRRKDKNPILTARDCRMWNTSMFFRKATVHDVNTCLAAGANPKARSLGKRMPLHWAAQSNENPEVIAALVRAGADPNARADDKKTPLHYASGSNENPEVIAALVRAGADPNARDNADNTPLHYASHSTENPAVIAALVRAGADPNARDRNKRTPLHRASGSNENPEVIAALVRAGADPNARDNADNTPLHYASHSTENPAVIAALVGAGANLNARNKYKDTPLHYASGSNENPEVIAVLVRAGANLNARDDDKRTPLYWASRSNENPEVVAALMRAGGPNARNRATESLLRQLAQDCRMWNTRWFFRKATVQDVNTCLAAGAEPSLHSAGMYTDNPEVIAALVRAGANLNARDSQKTTPLHYAARSNENPEVIAVLVRAGANLNARNEYKDTPLHYAVSYNENPEVIAALVRAGANLNARDDDKRTPLKLAIWRNNLAATEILRHPTMAHARRKPQSGPGVLGAAIGIIGGAAITAAGGGTDEAAAAGTIFAERVIRGQSPAGGAGGVSRGQAGNVGAGPGGGSCEIPGYPRPANVQNLGLAWCPASVDFQVRSLALQVAGAQCAIATGSSSTPEQIQARRQEIQAVCDRLAALGVSNCQCP